MGLRHAVADSGHGIWFQATIRRDNITMGVAQDQGSLYGALVGGDPLPLCSEPVRSTDVIVVKISNEGAFGLPEDRIACRGDAEVLGMTNQGRGTSINRKAFHQIRGIVPRTVIHDQNLEIRPVLR